MLGPQDAGIAKIKDVYRKSIYVKNRDYQVLVDIKDIIDEYLLDNNSYNKAYVFFDFDPVNTL